MNCKPGDLALVIGARLTPSMIGRIVEVVRAADPKRDRYVPTMKSHSWLCRSLGAPIEWDGEMVSERVIADALLRPIRPNDKQSETEREKELTA